MSRIHRGFAVLAASVLLLAAPAAHAAGDAGSANAKRPTIIIRDLPAQVRLVPGEQAKLILSTNRTTGYTWSTKVTGSKASITVSKGVYTAPTTELMGAPGSTAWTITAKSAGKAVVNVIATPPGGGTGETQKLTVIVS